MMEVIDLQAQLPNKSGRGVDDSAQPALRDDCGDEHLEKPSHLARVFSDVGSPKHVEHPSHESPLDDDAGVGDDGAGLSFDGRVVCWIAMVEQRDS